MSQHGAVQLLTVDDTIMKNVLTSSASLNGREMVMEEQAINNFIVHYIHVLHVQLLHQATQKIQKVSQYHYT